MLFRQKRAFFVEAPWKECCLRNPVVRQTADELHAPLRTERA